MSASKLPLALLCFALAACSGSKGTGPTAEKAPEGGEAAPAEKAGLPDRDPALAKRLVKEEGALLLDVRSADEFAEGHVDGAVQIPHDELADRLGEVLDKQGGDKHKPIVVYCRSGHRAGIAKDVLTENGFDQVTNLGGFSDWPGE
jgi:phage shock protein E